MIYGKFEALFVEQSSDLIWIVDSKLLLTYANQSYLKLMKQVTGSEKKLQEPILVEGFGKGYIEKWTTYYNRALSGEYFELEEHYSLPETNEIQYGQIIFNPVRDDNQQVIAVACQSRDITRIVRQRSEAQQLMDASLDVFCTINETGNFVFVSDAATKHWGYSPQELIGTPYVSLILEEDIPKTKDIVDAILSGEEVKSFINRYKRKDGGIAYNQWSARWDSESKLMYCVARDAGEKIEQEILLHLSEQRFKALVQEGSDLIAILDANGNYRYVSPTSFTVLGMQPEEFVGRSPFDFIHPEDAERTLASLKKITDQQKVLIEPFRFKNNDQEWRWIETVLTNMLDNPAVNGIVANSRDVTESLSTLKEIKAHGQFNRAIIESSPDCLKILDTEGQLLYMNSNGCSLMEIDDFSEFQNKKWWELWGTENETLVKESIEKALLGQTANFLAYGPTAKGTPKWWDVMVSAVSTAGEPIQKIISVSRDITAQKQEEQRLKLLESVITNTRDAVLITEAEPLDEPGPRILYVNEAFCNMTGYTAEEVIGKTPRILQGPKSDQAELKRLSKALRRWEPCEITTINYKKNGDEFWINFSVSPVADKNGWYTHWIAIERDVTQQKQKEIEKELLGKISEIFSFENSLLTAVNELCKTISENGNFDFVEMWLPNIENTQINLLAQSQLTSNAEIFYRQSQAITSFNLDEGLPGRVWNNKTFILWDEIDKKEDFIRKRAAEKADIKSVLGIPLFSNTDFVGVMVIATQRSTQYLHRFVNLFNQLDRFIGSEINRKKLENDLNHLYESIPDIVCVADSQGRFLKINGAGCQLLGYSEEELLYHNFDEFVFPEDKDVSTKEMANLVEGKSNFSFENRYIKKSGEICWLSWSCKANLQEGLIYASAKNITTEKKLRELNRTTSILARIGSWEIDLINDKIFWTKMVHQLHETDPVNFEPTFTQAIEFYREDFRKMVVSEFEQCLQSGKPFDFEAVIITLNKNELWIRVIGNAEFVNGKCIRIYGSFQDINERKEANLRLQSLADNLPGVVFQYLIYPDGTDALKYVTEGAKEIWEHSPEEVMENIDLVWMQTQAGGDFNKVKQNIKDSVKTKTEWVSRYKSITPSGKIRTLLATGTPNFLADGTVVYNSVVLDITKEAQNEALLKQASNMAKIGSWELDLINQDTDAMYWSPMTRAILEVDEHYNPSLTGGFEFYTGDSKQRIQQKVSELIQSGNEFDEELLVITPTGKEKWIRCIGKSEQIKEKCIKIYGSFQDIHASKSLEIQIREILESISDAFYAVDADWRFTYFNREAENLLLKKAEDVIGKSMWHEFPATLGTTLEETYYRVLASGESEEFEYFFPENNKWYEINAYPSNKGVSVYFKNIDERKRSDEALKEALEEKTLILESIGDAFFAVDNNWTVTYWNKEAEIVLGKKREDILGKHLWAEYLDATDSDFYRKYHKAMGTGETAHFEEYYPTLGKWFEVSAYPSKYSLSVYFKDVTLRKEADLRLINAHQEKTRILERITEAFVSLDTNWCYSYMNKQAGEIFNRDPKKIIGKHIWTEFPEGLNQPFHLAYEKAMATQEYIYLEEHYEPYDRWFENHIYPSPDGISIFFRDVTERKRSEERIIMANERFEKVTEATNDAIWDWNIDDNTLYWGSGFKNLFGYKVDKITPTLDFWIVPIHPEDKDWVFQSVNEVLEKSNESNWAAEYRYLKNNGTYANVINRGVIIRDKTNKAIRMVGAMTDISERKQFEHQLLELNASLKKQALDLEITNEELEKFAYIASHDLQEPLRMVTSFMDQLKRKYENQLDEKGLQYIYFATDGAKRMKKIILDLLEYSRAGKLTEASELVDLNEILDNFKILRRKVIHEKLVEIRNDKLPILESHKAPLTQVLHCLIDNAIHYSKNGHQPIISISTKDIGGFWEVEIADNGIGIDPQFHKKIFIIFQRLHNKDKYEGTGIGLSIVKKHVESWGGKIWLESTLGKGTTFYFTIPKKHI